MIKRFFCLVAILGIRRTKSQTLSVSQINIQDSGNLCANRLQNRNLCVTLPQESTRDEVDLFFLIDDTEGFEPEVAVIRRIIASTITEISQTLAVDLGVGIGRFQDFGGNASGFTGANSQTRARPFILNQPIVTQAEATTRGQNFQELIDVALNQTNPFNPGFATSAKSSIEALYQIAVGDGFDGNGDGITTGLRFFQQVGRQNTQTNPDTSGDVPAFSTRINSVVAAGTIGGAGFRPNALKLVIVATDACAIAPFSSTAALKEDVTSIYGSESANSFQCDSNLIPTRAGVVSNSVSFTDTTVQNAVVPLGAHTVSETVDALVREGIRVIGMAPGGFPTAPGSGPSNDESVHLSALARITGAISGEGIPLLINMDSTDSVVVTRIVSNVEALVSIPASIELTSDCDGVAGTLEVTYPDGNTATNVEPGDPQTCIRARFDLNASSAASDVSGSCALDFQDSLLGISYGTIPFSFECNNDAPIALCRDVPGCNDVVTVDDVDDGSSDPESDPIIRTLSPEGPYTAIGGTNVTLTVSDGVLEGTCEALVNFECSMQPSTSPSLEPSLSPSGYPSGEPSALPSLVPSSEPSSSPSVKPSSLPSLWPSGGPSSKPSEIPSLIPSATPSTRPSSLPSTMPSGDPSATPSLSPTAVPSLMPSGGPSKEPSDLPSLMPSVTPSTPPSASPSLGPSSAPSANPSARPSSLPSLWPSGEPSGKPSSTPSLMPSATPSAHPSSLPSIMPSSEPSATPSISPTVAPSLMPSFGPSGEPSDRPSLMPSATPSARPSTSPSSMPSRDPSATPSVSPTMAPSRMPSSGPSGEPSDRPSLMPSLTPSARPSTSPSSVPSSEPSTIPSASPTVAPSLMPSSGPSREPSDRPSLMPSVTPSARPSTSPSSMPSSEPSATPSVSPSNLPSLWPSGEPSGEPSSTPSLMPSATPSARPSSVPTSTPSSDPSATPSLQPSATPSALPSADPSSIPSFSPTSMPSAGPSFHPSASPSSVPSGAPSATPSAKPSVEPSASPSSKPSATPSRSPSAQPSTTPSAIPSLSSIPTSVPSLTPTSLPTKVPSTAPSGRPSVNPTSLDPEFLNINATDDFCVSDVQQFDVCMTVSSQTWTTAVDIFFLLDSTSSFTRELTQLTRVVNSTIASLQDNLRQVSFGFGVGRMEDYGGPSRRFGGRRGRRRARPFILNQPIITQADAGSSMELEDLIYTALTRNQIQGGGPFPDIAVAEALFQVATGVGLDADGDGNTTGLDQRQEAGRQFTQRRPDTTGDVPAFSTLPGFIPVSGTIGGVGFREDALKIVVLGAESCLIAAYEAGQSLPTTISTAFGSEGSDDFVCSNVLGGENYGFVGDSRVPADNQIQNAVVPLGGATLPTAIQALVNQGIRVIGLSPEATPENSGDGPSNDPDVFLSALARSTGAVDESGTPIIIAADTDDDLDLVTNIVNAIESAVTYRTNLNLDVECNQAIGTVAAGTAADVTTGDTACFSVRLTPNAQNPFETCTAVIEDSFLGIPYAAVPISIDCNQAPFALCQDVRQTNCQTNVDIASIDAGSNDPDSDSITREVSPESPYAFGDTTVTLKVSDGRFSDTCMATVTIECP